MVLEEQKVIEGPSLKMKRIGQTNVSLTGLLSGTDSLYESIASFNQGEYTTSDEWLNESLRQGQSLLDFSYRSKVIEVKNESGLLSIDYEALSKVSKNLVAEVKDLRNQVRHLCSNFNESFNKSIRAYVRSYIYQVRKRKISSIKELKKGKPR